VYDEPSGLVHGQKKSILVDDLERDVLGLDFESFGRGHIDKKGLPESGFMRRFNFASARRGRRIGTGIGKALEAAFPNEFLGERTGYPKLAGQKNVRALALSVGYEALGLLQGFQGGQREPRRGRAGSAPLSLNVYIY
jgi:hypothetical protein